MNSTQSLLKLPSGFTTVKEIKEKEDSKGQYVSIIGFVVDWMPPFHTRGGGGDWKCTLKLKDLSIQDDDPFEFAFFSGQEKYLPARDDIKVADVIIIRKAKVQLKSGVISIMSHFSTQVLVATFPKSNSTSNPHAAVKWRSYSVKGVPSEPKHEEIAYTVEANLVKDMSLPTDEEFTRKAKEADVGVYRKEKFKLLKDVKPDDYCDLIGEIVRVYGQNNSPIEVYLSDYTANTNFFDYICKDDPNSGEFDGDEHGYIKSKRSEKENDQWLGPYGKLSISVNVWDPHATYILEKVNLGNVAVKSRQWVFLQNVHIQYGKNGNKLEGYLREDRNASAGKIQVSIMEEYENPSSSDLNYQRWKEAVRRKIDWWKKHDQKQTEKRKNDGFEPLKMNGKMRRLLSRAEKRRKIIESTVQAAEKLDLNENVVCAYPDIQIMSLKNILEPQQLLLPQEYRGPLSPFTNCKYRAHVRVVDYFPERVEDFAVGRRPSDYDILSDYSGGEDTDSEGDMRLVKSGKDSTPRKWEWRFALQVIDASSKNSTERMWLMVGNQAAQALLNIDEDAADLREDPLLLHKVKEQLFQLWGDLEERKTALLPKANTKNELHTSFMESEIPASSPPQRPGTQPDVDSDEETEHSGIATSTKPQSAVLEELDTNLAVGNETEEHSNSKTELAPKNKAFTCCIQQYGVIVEESDSAKANAGDGKRWQRMFGLFGTQIR